MERARSFLFNLEFRLKREASALIAGVNDVVEGIG
jgi:hypothetical protein